MNPIFSINSINDRKLQIFGLTYQDGQYLPEDIDENSLEGYYMQNIFRYSDTYTLNIIQYHSTEKDEVVGVISNKHDTVIRDLCEYIIEKDGYYTIYHIILPTIQWLEVELEKEQNILNEIHCYVTDGCSIYYYDGENLILQDLEVFTEINTNGTTISLASKKIFNVVYLYECYINKCKQSLKDSYNKCPENLNEDLIYIRDLIWITLCVIRYLTELEKYEEAQNIIEVISKCNYICNLQIKSNKQNCNCK